MSSSSSRSSTPPWVSTFKEQVEGNEKDPKMNTYALSTLSPEGLPKVRHVIHRALTPSSNLLISTTDTRMQKPVHLSSHHTYEIAWWFLPSAVQFRITGEAYVIPNDPGSSETSKVLKAIGATGDEAEPEWWEKERQKQWKESMSGHLRASFGRPTPGTPLDQVPPPETWDESLPASSDVPEEQKKIDKALSHFALIALRVDAFENLELKPVPNTRTQWTRQEDGEWKEVKVAP